jgi:hypothetical protein
MIVDEKFIIVPQPLHDHGCAYPMEDEEQVEYESPQDEFDELMNKYRSM